MRANMMTICRGKVIVALLFILGVMLSLVGCTTSYPQSYLSTNQMPYGPRLIIPGLKVEHNLFNNKAQRVDKDEIESDWSG